MGFFGNLTMRRYAATNLILGAMFINLLLFGGRLEMGEAFTAKDFRTWGGTLAASRLLAEMPWDEAGASQRAMASMRKAVETDVARQLGNTPAVCRKSYIDPRVYAAWEQGWLARASNGVRGPRQWEALALRLLRRRA